MVRVDAARGRGLAAICDAGGRLNVALKFCF
jgi:hypothetical protein